MKGRRGPGRLRVIAGSLRGRRLLSLSGPAVRPTADRVREALFDILGDRVADSRFLDAYAGTGAVGIEALSRGARAVAFVERDHRAAELIRRNLASLETRPNDESARVPGGARLLEMDLLDALAALGREGELFDLIFLDPPYGGGELERAVRLVSRATVAADGAAVIAEHDARVAPPAAERLTPARTAVYGRAALTFYGAVPRLGPV